MGKGNVRRMTFKSERKIMVGSSIHIITCASWFRRFNWRVNGSQALSFACSLDISPCFLNFCLHAVATRNNMCENN